MSGLFATLSSASRSLDAQTQAIDVTSNNIANMNNASYARETVQYKSLGEVQSALGPESMGVTTSVQQAADPLLNQMVMNEASLTSGYTAEQSIYQQAQAALGESLTSSSTSSSGSSTTSDSGLQASISAFFSAVQNFAANPTDNGERAALVSQAGVLCDRFQSIDSNLAEVQSAATAQATAGVSSANTLLSNIASFNTQIASLEAANGSGTAVDLRDQREAAEEKLAALMPVSVTHESNGEDTITTPASSGSSVTLVSAGTVEGPLSYSSSTGLVTGGSSGDQLALASGSISGALTAGTGSVQTLRDNLDAIAKQIVTSVNSAYNPTSSSTGNFFESSGTTASSIALDPNLSATSLTAGTDGSGDNSIALALADVANTTYATTSNDAINGTISQAYADTVSGIGQALDTANTQVSDQTAVQNIVTQQRASVSGVSLNEEMANLMSYQQAYQASSEVFSVVNSVMSDLQTAINS